MFFDTSHRASLLSTGILVLTAAGVAIASDDVREVRVDITECLAVVTAMEQASQLEATEERLEATMPARPAPVVVEPPEVERVSLPEGSYAPELREPELPRPTLRLHEADELFLERILSSGVMPARPAPVIVEAPDVRVESLREGLEVPELREPGDLEKPDIQH